MLLGEDALYIGYIAAHTVGPTPILQLLPIYHPGPLRWG